MSARHPHLHVRFAASAEDILAAQRLRYDVFVSELGGDGDGVDHAAKTEVDAFDTVARHLLLCDQDRIVGVYRLLDQAGAAQIGEFYSESEYDLTALKASNRNVLELGRSCIHPDYRNGLGLMHLWEALADYVLAADIDVIFGVASFHGADPSAHRHALAHLAESYLADEEIRPKAKQYHPMAGSALTPEEKKAALSAMPSLIKSYLRLGGKVGDGAFIDHAFNTTDVCLLLDTSAMTARASMLLPKGSRDG